MHVAKIGLESFGVAHGGGRALLSTARSSDGEKVVERPSGSTQR